VFFAHYALFVDHFAGIAGPSLDVNGLFDDGPSAGTESLPNPVLREGEGYQSQDWEGWWIDSIPKRG